MLVAILHNAVSADAAPDERDVLVQRDVVNDALRRLGYQVVPLPCSLDLEATRRELLRLRPDVVFNLVEALGGSDWLMFLPTALLDALNLPYTGSPTEAMLQTTHKILAKQQLAAAGLPTPAWVDEGGQGSGVRGQESGDSQWIVKAVREHASIGMDDGSVITTDDVAVVRERLQEKFTSTQTKHFAERFVAGREFNLSLLAAGGDVHVLPPAEIDFSLFPPDKPAIVGYAAKWDEASAEYQHTPRRFDFAASDRPLLAELSRLAVACWRRFELRGYARVDFRVDHAGQPWILEINANPCLSPDAGFAAALLRGGVPFDQAIANILAAATNAPHAAASLAKKQSEAEHDDQ